MATSNTVTLDRDFDSVVESVKAALAEQGFGVLTEIDMQATMKNKLGESYDPYLILGACNPPLAHRALQADKSIGTLLPCNVVVRQVDDGILVEAIDPQVMVEFTGVAELASVSDDASERLTAAMDSLR